MKLSLYIRWWEVAETGRRLLLTSLLTVGYMSAALKLSVAVLVVMFLIYSSPGGLLQPVLSSYH